MGFLDEAGIAILVCSSNDDIQYLVPLRIFPNWRIKCRGEDDLL